MKDSDEEKRRQMRIVQNLAVRLPWVAVWATLVAFGLIFLQMYFFGNR